MQKIKIKWQNTSALELLSNKNLSFDWDQLNAERCGIPFLTSDATALALRIFGSGTERLLIGRQNDTVVAMLVLVPDGTFKWRTFQPSQIPLGVWVAAHHLSAYDILRSLIRGPLGFCLGLSMTQADPLLCPREDDQADTKTIDYIETGWIDVVGTFDTYWAARGKNLRQNMRKQRNKLAAEGIHLRMETLSSPEDMKNAIARYGNLENSGWKASEGTAIHPDNPQGKFYTQLLENLALSGNAVVYEYYFNEKTVASNICILSQETLVILKTTYDETIQNYSPAFLLNQDEVEKIFGMGRIKRIEYYGRMMEWHTRWTDNKRTLYHLNCYRWPFLKKIIAYRQKSAQHIPTAESTVLPGTSSQNTPQESHP